MLTNLSTINNNIQKLIILSFIISYLLSSCSSTSSVNTNEDIENLHYGGMIIYCLKYYNQETCQQYVKDVKKSDPFENQNNILITDNDAMKNGMKYFCINYEKRDDLTCDKIIVDIMKDINNKVDKATPNFDNPQ